jgi:hypothetical protein
MAAVIYGQAAWASTLLKNIIITDVKDAEIHYLKYLVCEWCLYREGYFCDWSMPFSFLIMKFWKKRHFSP